MSLKHRKKTILAKIEPVYGVDSVPAAVANGIEVVDLQLTPIAGQRAVHRVERPYYGNYQQTVVGEHVMTTFKVAVAGAGAAGTAPAYGVLLRGCGHAETINAGVDVQYDPVSQNEESLTMYVNFDGTLHKLIGSRGAMTGISLDSEGYPYYNFSFIGLFVDPADDALPDPDLTAFQKPVPFINANSSVSLLGQTPSVKNIEISSGQAVKYRNVVGSESVQITAREPTAQIQFEAVPIATYDYFGAVRNQVTGAFTVTHGPAGNQVVFSAPKVQLSDINRSADDDIMMFNVPLTMLPNSTAGDDDYKITVK